jgi:hypothetical protein
MFITKINTGKEPEKCAIRSEIPVTPPSINPLGIKKPFRPNPADRIPIEIIKKSFKKFVNVSPDTFFFIIK